MHVEVLRLAHMSDTRKVKLPAACLMGTES